MLRLTVAKDLTPTSSALRTISVLTATFTILQLNQNSHCKASLCQSPCRLLPLNAYHRHPAPAARIHLALPQDEIETLGARFLPLLLAVPAKTKTVELPPNPTKICLKVLSESDF